MKRSMALVIFCLIGIVGCSTTYERALDAERNGNLLEAAKLYERHVDENLDKGINSGSSLTQSADFYAKLGQYDEAIRVYKKSIAFGLAPSGSKSSLPYARANLAKVYVARGNAQGAAAEIGAVVNDCTNTSYDAGLTFACETVLPESRALIVGNLDLTRRLNIALANATAQGLVERAALAQEKARQPALKLQREQEERREVEQQTALRRQEIFSAVASTAQALGAQQRTNAAIDAQMKADAARRAAEQDRLQRSTSVNDKTVTSPATNYSSSGQSTSTGSTTSQLNSGSARDMASGNTGGTTGRPNQGTGAGVQSGGSQSTGTAKFQSQDATACVEIVPKGFKCDDGSHTKYLTNICRNKITVQWRLGNDSWGQQSLAPSQCYPTSYYKDERTVQYKACSWDAKANYGPYMDPCRY